MGDKVKEDYVRDALNDALEAIRSYIRTKGSGLLVSSEEPFFGSPNYFNVILDFDYDPNLASQPDPLVGFQSFVLFDDVVEDLKDLIFDSFEAYGISLKVHGGDGIFEIGERSPGFIIEGVI